MINFLFLITSVWMFSYCNYYLFILILYTLEVQPKIIYAFIGVIISIGLAIIVVKLNLWIIEAILFCITIFIIDKKTD